MSDEKKEESCCSSKGCGHCCFVKLLIGMLIGAFIFASGIWFGKAHCHPCQMGTHGYCPLHP